MKKTLSLILSAMLIAATLFALPFNAMAEPKDISENPLDIQVTGCKFNEYGATLDSVDVEVRDSGVLLEENTDYTIDYEKYNLSVDSDGNTFLNFYIVGMGNYTGEVSDKYVVKAPTKGKAGAQAKWAFYKKTNTLAIYGKGKVTNARKGSAKNVYFTGVNAIGSYWHNIKGEEYNEDINVTNVTIAGTVKTVDKDALRLLGVKNIDLQSGVKTLKAAAIAPMSANYKSLYVPKSVTKIGSKAVGYRTVKSVYEEDANYKYSKVKGFVIIGESGSAAQKYAKKNKFKFVALKPSAISKLKAGAKSFTVNWKQAKGATGCQIQYSTNKYFATGNKTVKVKGAKNVKKTIKKLKKGQKYYVRVRTYKTVKKKAYYSCWSATKAVTAK